MNHLSLITDRRRRRRPRSAGSLGSSGLLGVGFGSAKNLVSRRGSAAVGSPARAAASGRREATLPRLILRPTAQRVPSAVLDSAAAIA